MSRLICSLCTYWWVLEKVITGQLLRGQPNGYKVTYIVWCESTCLSWVDSPDQGNGSGELLGSPEWKWGVPGEWGDISGFLR